MDKWFQSKTKWLHSKTNRSLGTIHAADDTGKFSRAKHTGAQATRSWSFTSSATSCTKKWQAELQVSKKEANGLAWNDWCFLTWNDIAGSCWSWRRRRVCWRLGLFCLDLSPQVSKVSQPSQESVKLKKMFLPNQATKNPLKTIVVVLALEFQIFFGAPFSLPKYSKFVNTYPSQCESWQTAHIV